MIQRDNNSSFSIHYRARDITSFAFTQQIVKSEETEIRRALISVLFLAKNGQNHAKRLLKYQILKPEISEAIDLYCESLRQTEKAIQNVFTQAAIFGPFTRLKLYLESRKQSNMLNDEGPKRADTVFTLLESNSIMLRTRAIPILQTEASRSERFQWISESIRYIKFDEEKSWSDLTKSMVKYDASRTPPGEVNGISTLKQKASLQSI